MSFTRKSLRDTADRPLQALPELPTLISLSGNDRETLIEWWRKVRDVLDRQDDAMRLLADSLRTELSTQISGLTSRLDQVTGVDEPAAAGQPVSQIQVTGGSGVSEDRVYSIVRDAIQSARYVHTQGFPSQTWRAVHNLGWKPSVTVIDSMDNIVIGDVRHISATELEITFSNQFSGTAYLT
jgi:hypothetical protein